MAIYRLAVQGFVVVQDYEQERRASFTPGDHKYSFRMEVSQDGENWMTLMEGSYERQIASAAAS